MHFRDGVTGAQLQGEFLDSTGFVSAGEQPNDPGNQGAPCAGNLCEIANVLPDGNGLQGDFINDTCTDYFFYVVVRTTPATDASTE